MSQQEVQLLLSSAGSLAPFWRKESSSLGLETEGNIQHSFLSFQKRAVPFFNSKKETRNLEESFRNPFWVQPESPFPARLGETMSPSSVGLLFNRGAAREEAHIAGQSAFLFLPWSFIFLRFCRYVFQLGEAKGGGIQSGLI